MVSTATTCVCYLVTCYIHAKVQPVEGFTFMMSTETTCVCFLAICYVHAKVQSVEGFILLVSTETTCVRYLVICNIHAKVQPVEAIYGFNTDHLCMLSSCMSHSNQPRSGRLYIYDVNSDHLCFLVICYVHAKVQSVEGFILLGSTETICVCFLVLC